MKVLANDGISQSGIDILKDAGFEVLTVHVAQEQLQNYINEHKIEVLLVRSAPQNRWQSWYLRICSAGFVFCTIQTAICRWKATRDLKS